MLPLLIEQNKDTILNIHHEMNTSKDFQTIPYDKSEWLAWFPHDRNISGLINRFPGTISRSNLAILSRETITDRNKSRSLFIATMMWGHGTARQMRNPGGYRSGADITAESLNDPKANKLIEYAVNGVLNGNAGEVKFWLPQCGPVYVSKFFYAIALGADLHPMPLVLDQLVWITLNEMGTTRATSLYNKEQYVRYLNDVDKWSDEISCRPDAIEYFLFVKGKEIKKQRRNC
jgi:hypothetical protein